jgi:hypothetical protein
VAGAVAASLPLVPDPYDVPSRRDAVVATVSGFMGGPVGRHAVIGARGLVGVAAALTVVASVVIALGVWQKGHCLLKGWSNPDQFWRMCYSDLPVLHVTSGLADRSLPYVDGAPIDQAPLSGTAMWLISLVSPEAGTGVPAQQWVFGIWAVLALLLLAAGATAVVALRPRRPWQAAHLVASPVLVVLALVSTDLLGIAMTLWALWCWRTGRLGTAGALFGLAALVRPYPLVFLAAAVFLALRSGRPVGRLLASAALAVAVVVLPLLVLDDGVLHPVRVWWAAGPGYGGMSLVPHLLGSPLSASAATGIALAGWVLALGLGAVLAFRSATPPGLARLAGPMLLVVVLTAKAVPVQTGLWLLPVLALSAVVWRDHLVWAATELVHFVTVWLHIGFGSDPGKGLPGDTYALFVLLRMAGWAWVVWQVWWAVPRRVPEAPGAPATVGGSYGTTSSLPVVEPEARSS